MKFYSGQGDDGSSHLLHSGKRSKSELIFDALGAIDEASAFLSLAALHIKDEELNNILAQIQQDLYYLMAELAGDEKNSLSGERISWLEEKINSWGKEVELPADFIHSWKNPASALLNIARTVVRRAERTTVGCFEKKQIENSEILSYLNRLSSLIYVLQLYLENISVGK